MNPAQYVRETIDVAAQIESRFIELGARLYRIREQKLWADSYEDYTDFLDAAHINPSMASMLYSIHKNYVVDGHKDPEKLAGIGYSNLYEAIPLIEREGVSSALVKAETLTRSEIKDEVRDQNHGEHEHLVGDEQWGKCNVCGKFIRIR